MNTTSKLKLTALLYGAAQLAHANTAIPDFDFEAADGLAWEINGDEPALDITFPATGGNPGGHARLDNSDGIGWAILVSNTGIPLTLTELGLTAGQSYTFSQDMKIFSGSNIGGLKVDFFIDTDLQSDSSELKPVMIGDGSTWETYEFQITIPATANGIKIVPLWGDDSDVGYDNLTFSTTPIVVPDITEIPNGDFEAGNFKWAQAGEPSTTFTYPTTGGNPTGHAVMTHDDSADSFGVLVANSSAVIPIAGLGLTAGESYNFKQDMKILSGSAIGGLKVEFLNGTTGITDTGNEYPTLIGDGSTWETYTFPTTLPLNTTAIKIVPVWGQGSSVAYDNVTIDPTIIPSPPVANFDFEAGSSNWSQFKSGNGVTTFDFPATGGNPGGYAEIANTSEWAVIVSNNASFTPLSKFGITEEGTYEFKLDMKIFAGSNIGGLKIEYGFEGEAAGDSTEIYPSALIGDGSTWETYTFDIFIPDGIDSIKVTPAWGPGSTVGFDNIIVPTASPAGFAGWIAGFPDVGALTGPNDDPDNDGNPNALENFFGTDPSLPSQGLVAGRILPGAGRTFTFTHSQNATPVEDISAPVYTWSTDLQNYHADNIANPAGTTTVRFLATTDSPSAGVTTVEAIVTGSVIPEKLFVRVAVNQAP